MEQKILAETTDVKTVEKNIYENTETVKNRLQRKTHANMPQLQNPKRTIRHILQKM